MTCVSPSALSSLRQELKGWEQSFFSEHGRKPSREDIKNDPYIASKYKSFNRARKPPDSDEAGSGPSTPQKRRRLGSYDTKALREKPVNVRSTPQKTSLSTPHKGLIAIEEQPSEPTPIHVRCALGPTPHKDGLVLGLFDTLDSNPTQSQLNDDGHETINTACTPSKNAGQSAAALRHSRTPRSSSKRFLLEAFAGTPLKRKRDADDIGTPGSSKKPYDTPAFLRRDHSFEQTFRIPDQELGKDVRSKRGLVRSLSTIIANLRKSEEERMDDEWEVMRDMEAGGYDKEGSHAERLTYIQDDVSQVPDMPLGPDKPLNDHEDSSAAEQETGRKPWKKKGLKRQTKRVKMRPVLHAPQKADNKPVEEGQNDETDHAAVETGQEEQPGGLKKVLRKVNEAAHMNFRRLKIKNKNSKAGGRGKFGRR